MKSIPNIATALALALASFVAVSSPALAQSRDEFRPEIGQAGKDVIWVPSPDDVVERMLSMAQVTSSDFVIDLGSGDGKIAIMAARKFGARAVGVEYNPNMVKLSQKNAAAAGVADRVTFRNADIFATDFTQATVITMYLLPSLNLKLRPQILAMRPGTRVSSHSFTMDDWEADEISNVDGKRAYFWIVPANVQGAWNIETTGTPKDESGELNFEQHFQRITGTLTFGPLAAGLREPQLRGTQVAFIVVDPTGTRREYAGRVNGSRMEGTFRYDNGASGRWTATKK